MGRRGRGEVGRIGRVTNSKVELRWVVVVGGCKDDFRDRSSTVSIEDWCTIVVWFCAL